MKGEFEFVIPLTLDGLQESQSTRQYAVTLISSSNEIPKRLQECQASFRSHGPDFICDGQYFEAMYSVLWRFRELDSDVRSKAFDLIVKVLTSLTSELASVLDGIASLSSTQRLRWLNAIKMNTFLAVQLTEIYENFNNKPSQDLLIGKGRKRGAAAQRDEGAGLWEDQRLRVLVQLYSLLQHPLPRLCSPPVMEEDYVNLVANCCYKILETPSISHARCKPTRDSLFQIIGSLIIKYNHALACSLKIVQLVQHFEHLASVFATGLSLLVTSFGCVNVVNEVIREIAKMDLGGAEVSSSKDSSGVRQYTQFLVELAEQVPQALVPSLPLLFTFLDNDNFSLRNCILSMMGSLVFRVLSREDLDEKNRDLRDNCLECIEDHVMDVNAFVRSKVLQILTELVENNALPLAKQPKVLELTVVRLMDKSASVRKNALTLLTAFLKQNPFAAKLPLADLKQQLETEEAKLKEMNPDELPLQQDSQPKPPSAQQVWQDRLEAVVEAVVDVLSEDSDCDSVIQDQLSDDCSLNDALSQIATALDTGKMHRAAVLLSGALEAFNGASVLSFDPASFPMIHRSEGEELTAAQQQHVALLQRIFLSSQAMNRHNDDDKTDKPKEREEVTKQRHLVVYLKDCVCFARLIQASLPVVVQLLSSKLVTDVLEAIKFFITAYEFGVMDAMVGVRQMLKLVWSREQQVQTAVVDAYRRLYINSEAVGERARAANIVSNLTALVAGATLGELASLEEIIAQFMSAGDLNKPVITLLWERFTLALNDTTSQDAKAALTLLAMAANSEPNIVNSNIAVLVSSGLGERGEHDFSLVKETCVALSKIATTKPKADSNEAPFRLAEDHEMFSRLSCILINGISKREDRQYSPMAVQAITTIYSLAEHPDQICAKILKDIYKNMSEAISDDGEENTSELSMPTFLLSRYLVLVSRIAIRQLVHLDVFVFSELKRRNNLKEELETQKKACRKIKAKKKEDKNKRKSLMTSASEVSLIKGTPPEGDIDEELGLMGAVADDMEAEYIRGVCDRDIVTGDNLLAATMPLIVHICSNPSKYKDPELQAAAVLALANCMMVSADCCEQQLQLLFTILEKSDDPVIRGNIIIALGDLSFRFPNLVEPWTPRIYARLGDDCCSVRNNAIIVLTHLILNDMVKVKGQISDIALCITDPEHRISGLAKLFFTELARKANALYNVLPDIISRLSDPETELEEHKYRMVIGHILSLLQKDRQVEGLVEKLCHRLQAAQQPRQWRDITYCLSLLQFNERCVRKLLDLFACFADKLYEPDVHKMILSILAKARKLAKPEMKTVIEELETKIEASHAKGVEEQNLVDKASVAKRGFRRRGNVRVAGRNRKASSSSDSDFDDKIVEESTERRRSDRVKRSAAKAAVLASSENESES